MSAQTALLESKSTHVHGCAVYVIIIIFIIILEFVFFFAISFVL